MAEAYTKKSKIITPVFRVSYPHIWTPQRNETDTKDVYSVTMVFEPDADLTEMKALAMAIRTQKFGKEGKFKKAFKDVAINDTDENEEYRGKTVVSARSHDRPVSVVKVNKSVPKGSPGWLTPVTDRNEFYAGCYARASVTCYDYNHPQGGRGVSFGLQSLIFVRHGEPLVSISRPEDDFAEVDTTQFEDTDVDNSDLFDSDDL